jgi:signal-transduction protein with cAMP-binding, CBS, and nucleotidyltransferase domain
MELRDVVGKSSPVKISSTATASDALVSMIENKTDYLLVDRTGPHDAFGIVTRWDIVVEGVAKGRDLTKTPVLELSRKPLVVMNNLDLDIRWVAKKMANEGVSKIAVFDKEEFLGFISDIDIMRAVAAKKEAKK